MMKKTNVDQRKWYQIDATNFILGKLAVIAANILQGKDKKNFVRNQDCGDYLVITNAKNIKLSGNKATKEFWYNHSGYIGGIRKRSGKVMIEKYADELVTTAVKGMLPKNKLAQKMIKKLHVFKDGMNDKFKQQKFEILGNK